MPECACRFAGDLTTIEHRRFHRRWESERGATVLPYAAEATLVEVTDIYTSIDQLIAHAHGGPLPELTAGAQARIARHRLDNQETTP